jgi:hypothetical protein
VRSRHATSAADVRSAQSLLGHLREQDVGDGAFHEFLAIFASFVSRAHGHRSDSRATVARPDEERARLVTEFNRMSVKATLRKRMTVLRCAPYRRIFILTHVSENARRRRHAACGAPLRGQRVTIERQRALAGSVDQKTHA